LVGVHEENLGGTELNLRIILKRVLTKFGLDLKKVASIFEHGNKYFGSV
jgi:hypothetical protein